MLTVEKLLNSLIEKGWKPMGKEMTKCHRERCRLNSEFGEYWVFNHIGENGQSIDRQFCLKIREIVSKNSGLWQFVCKNKLVNKYADLGPDVEEAYIGKWKNGLDAVDINGNYIRLDDDYDEYHQDTDYKYRLIECALKDESELEDFLLDNIKVEWN